MKKITVIGAGYVGLVTAASLAVMGSLVICLDIDREKIGLLRKGIIPFHEPGLEELVKKVTQSGYLRFTDRYEEAIPPSDFCFFALPTPCKEDESCDIQHLFHALDQVAQYVKAPLTLVIKSTVPVGTGEKMKTKFQQLLQEKGKKISFHLVSNPEFLREGTAVKDSLEPDRVLIGVDSREAEKVMSSLFAPFGDHLLIMDHRSAELAKYAANTMLATRISFMNDLALFSEKVGANIESIRVAIGADPRIGSLYLRPGLGFGGSCLPKDVKALRAMAKEHHHPSFFLDSILQINERQKAAFFEKIATYYEHLSGKTLALWGLSFKPDTDDLRDAPSLYLIEKLLNAGVHLRLYDPVSLPKAKKLLPSTSYLTFCKDPYEAALNAQGIVLITEWEEFKNVELEKLAPLLAEKVFFDGRNQYNEKEMEHYGFSYFSVGKPPVVSLVQHNKNF